MRKIGGTTPRREPNEPSFCEDLHLSPKLAGFDVQAPASCFPPAQRGSSPGGISPRGTATECPRVGRSCPGPSRMRSAILRARSPRPGADRRWTQEDDEALTPSRQGSAPGVASTSPPRRTDRPSHRLRPQQNQQAQAAKTFAADADLASRPLTAHQRPQGGRAAKTTAALAGSRERSAPGRVCGDTEDCRGRPLGGGDAVDVRL